MGRAYKLTAEVVDSENYFIVDADNKIKGDFDLDGVLVPDEKLYIKIWSSENAVNGLVYGYGGLKLCNRASMRTLRDNSAAR
jgi:hypothetical protein